jgi:hypothetical protein
MGAAGVTANGPDESPYEVIVAGPSEYLVDFGGMVGSPLSGVTPCLGRTAGLVVAPYRLDAFF